MFPRLLSIPPSAFAVAVLLPAACTQAAVLSGSVTTTGLGTGVDLSATSDVNWAIWDRGSSTGVSSLSATNTMAVGPTVGTPGYISTITNIDGAKNVRGSSDGLFTFTYSDGASPAAESGVTIGGVIASTIDTVGEGIKFSIVGNVAQEYRVDVWTTGFRAVGQMTATLAGATTSTLQSQSYAQKDPTLFTYYFRPDTAGDVLNLSYVMSSKTTGGSASVGIQAVTITAVPEASSSLLLLGGITALGFRRRRAR